MVCIGWGMSRAGGWWCSCTWSAGWTRRWRTWQQPLRASRWRHIRPDDDSRCAPGQARNLQRGEEKVNAWKNCGMKMSFSCMKWNEISIHGNDSFIQNMIFSCIRVIFPCMGISGHDIHIHEIPRVKLEIEIQFHAWKWHFHAWEFHFHAWKWNLHATIFSCMKLLVWTVGIALDAILWVAMYSPNICTFDDVRHICDEPFLLLILIQFSQIAFNFLSLS